MRMIRKARPDHIVIELSDYDDRETASHEAMGIVERAFSDEPGPGWSCGSRVTQRGPNEVLVLTIRCKRHNYNLGKTIAALVLRGNDNGHDMSEVG